ADLPQELARARADAQVAAARADEQVHGLALGGIDDEPLVEAAQPGHGHAMLSSGATSRRVTDARAAGRRSISRAAASGPPRRAAGGGGGPGRAGRTMGRAAGRGA